MKKLIIISALAVVIVSLFVGGTVSAGKPTPPPPAPTSNVVMESGSGYLTANSTAIDTWVLEKAVFPPTFDPDTGTGGYDVVRHVSLTYALNVPDSGGGTRGELYVYAGSAVDPNTPGAPGGIAPIVIASALQDTTEGAESNSDGTTIEFDTYGFWTITLSDENNPDVGSYVTYSYTITYPSSQ